MPMQLVQPTNQKNRLRDLLAFACSRQILLQAISACDQSCVLILGPFRSLTRASPIGRDQYTTADEMSLLLPNKNFYAPLPKSPVPLRSSPYRSATQTKSFASSLFSIMCAHANFFFFIFCLFACDGKLEFFASSW